MSPSVSYKVVVVAAAVFVAAAAAAVVAVSVAPTICPDVA